MTDHKQEINRPRAKAVFFNLGFLFLLRLVARSYFFTFALPIVNFLVPVLIAFIYYEILPMQLSWPGLLAHPILTVGMLSLPLAMGSWNESVIIKRLKLSSIPTGQILFGFFFFYFLISLAAFLNVFLFFLAYSEAKAAVFPSEMPPQFLPLLKHVNYKQFFAGLFFLTCVSLAVGLLIAYSTFRFQTALFIGLTFYLTQAFLTGVFLSLDVSLRVKVMRYISYGMPIFPSVRMMQAAWLEFQPALGGYQYSGINWVLTPLDPNKKLLDLSFVNKYWVHTLYAVGYVGVISAVTGIVFSSYKPR